MRSPRVTFVALTIVLAGALFIGYPSLSASATVDGLTEVTTIPAASSPMYMALTPDGKTLYVVNRAPQSVTGRGSITVLDTRSNAVVATIGLEIGFPAQIAVTPNGKCAYLAVSRANGAIIGAGDNRVDVIDTETNTIVAHIPVSGDAYGPIGLAIAPDGKRAYVTHRGANLVHVIDTARNTVVCSVQYDTGLRAGPAGIALSPNGQRAYVANRLLSTVSVIDTRANAVVETIPVSLKTSTSTTSVAVSPNGKTVYVTFAQDDRVSVIDTDLGAEVGLISPGGGYLSQIALSPGGGLALVVSATTDEVFLLETTPGGKAVNTVVGSVQVGEGPFGVVPQFRTGDPSYSRIAAYVSNVEDGTVSVIGAVKGRNAKTVVEDATASMTPTPTLSPNVPNPFNSNTTLAFVLPNAGNVALTIHDIEGRSIRSVVEEYRPAGRYEVTWDGRDAKGRMVASGVYICQLQAGRIAQTRALLLLK